MKVRHIALVQETALGYYGQMVIEVALGGGLDATLLDVVTHIDKAIAELELKHPTVTICAEGAPTFDHEEVVELVLVLKSRGIPVISKSLGFVYPKWFGYCDYTVAIVTNVPWLRYACSELRYIPAEDEVLKEPAYVVQPKLRSVMLTSQRKGFDVFKFLRDSTNQWAVLSPSRFDYTAILFGEKQ